MTAAEAVQISYNARRGGVSAYQIEQQAVCVEQHTVARGGDGACNVTSSLHSNRVMLLCPGGGCHSSFAKNTKSSKPIPQSFGG